jgi:site-specific recombinase XerD
MFHLSIPNQKKHLHNYAPNLRLTDITPDWISSYVQHMEKTLMMQDVSVKKELKLLKWFFRWATKKGYLHEKAFDYDAKTRDTKKPVIFLSPEELIATQLEIFF